MDYNLKTWNCSVDLKLGSSGDSEDNWVAKFSVPSESSMESSSSGSLKRVRTASLGNHVPSCLVDGCTSDLSKCRDYHRRHKVCELHSKTSKVFIKGQEQRFCQQCSRFHSLAEFDEGKRSCRKRLDGHNRRRRKPQPDSLAVNSARLFSNHQGTRYLQFGSSELFSSSDPTSAWIGAVKTENDPMFYADQSSLNINIGKKSFPVSASESRGKHFPFLQCSSSTISPVCQSVLNAGSNGANRMIDSSRALSLLSSPPGDTREINLSHIVQHEHNPPGHQSLAPSLNFNSLGMETGPGESVMVSGGSGNVSLHNQDLFQIGIEGSSGNGSHQTLSFSWE
ncbi:teosinte glume architecture 1-like [Euphorbia lathyris]|uniref:teosinte glume architecture 1-like n=1 Tax=Euphorbia lathyris TaxID=212925 RepID=UPI0033133EF3